MTYSVLWDDDAYEDLGVVFDGADAALRDEISRPCSASLRN
jgi:hypothetical protein